MSKQTAFRLDNNIIPELKIIAYKENRSVNYMVNFILNAYIQNNQKPKRKTPEIKPEPQNPDNWQNSFELYSENCKFALESYKLNTENITKQQKYYPNINIIMTVQKAVENFWNTKDGWMNKKKSKIVDINWTQTFNKTLAQKINHVYLSDGLGKSESAIRLKKSSYD